MREHIWAIITDDGPTFWSVVARGYYEALMKAFDIFDDTVDVVDKGEWEYGS